MAVDAHLQWWFPMATNSVLWIEILKDCMMNLRNFVLKLNPWESSAFYQVPSPLPSGEMNISVVSLDCISGSVIFV
jgi:hypothetical protein